MSMLLPTRTFDPSQAHRLPIVLAARVVFFGLCFGLTAITPGQDQRFTSVLALLVVATLASLRYPGSSWTWLIPVVEGVLAAAVIGHSDPFNTALLPYLLVPALAVSLSKGFSGVVATTALAGAVIFAYQWSAFRSGSDSFDLALVGQWLVVALAIEFWPHLLTPIRWHTNRPIAYWTNYVRCPGSYRSVWTPRPCRKVCSMKSWSLLAGSADLCMCVSIAKPLAR